MSEAAAIDTAGICDRLDDVARRAGNAAERSGRRPGDVRVMLATKTQPAEAIIAAVQHGFALIGENRVQELVAKAADLEPYSHEAHLIGPLQSNKVNHALRHVSCIQSIDRLDIAEKIQRRLDVIDQTVDYYIQVNTSGEESKFGIDPAQAIEFARSLAPLDRLRLRGLMTIGLNSPDPDAVRPSYQGLVDVRSALVDAGFGDGGGSAATDNGAAGGLELSMGMSADFELAIEEGATLVRVGSSVFGARPQP
ncbi:YggS family pyridoxal phosphate-dependent enzyme [Spelaeicoccus albus]|uniref:Pyridoxal phosphate homeostasis protein n=1 Tax=Spelaeicoccus albus TaxID=1280376 RepID=A0A7Z0A8H9_9MICO|nr:YggS family pyridoxal phosphate-dependent enzyme [Spelaeicoccus albus]NYI66364.1 hypothetical protein [Spelaeicoccus albus]